MPRCSVYLFAVLLSVVTCYVVPDVKFEVFSPKGFKASIPDAPGLTFFVFQGHVNRDINENDVGSLSGEIAEKTNGRWYFTDTETALKIGDVINYYVFVSVDRSGYLKGNLSYKVTKYDNLQQTTSSSCLDSETKVRGMKVCSGQTIFVDNFDSLQENIWLVENKIPLDHPEYPFISYQRSAVKVENGNLVIRPSLQQNMPGFNEDAMSNGQLNLLTGCTSLLPGGCAIAASGANILPPVVSGRVSSKGFAFQYGIIEIKAKLPQGDWLYPEILLEPFIHKYGVSNYASGLIKIATARGNLVLKTDNNKDLGNEILYGGPILESKCHGALLRDYDSEKKWGDDYHVYSLQWRPDEIVLLVDNKEWAKFSPTQEGMFGLLKPICPDVANRWQAGTRIAPFDEEMTISLGIAAGGITEFEDNIYTIYNRKKPWMNNASKAKLHFWENLKDWHWTWSQNAALFVDYVKVIAL